MGRVLGVDEIATGQYPEPGAHLEAAKFLVDQLLRGHAYKDGGMGYIGVVHGSTVHGAANIRSDLDTVIMYGDAATTPTNDLEVIHNVFRDINSRYKVSVEANIVTLNDAVNGSHTIDPLFLKYLKQAQKNRSFTAGRPADLLAQGFSKGELTNRLYLAQILRGYIGAKSQSFAQALSVDSEMDNHRLQRALELPKNLGRKVLSMYDASFNVASATLWDIEKKVAEFIAERMFSFDGDFKEEVLSDLQDLVMDDGRYEVLLRETIEDRSAQSLCGL